MGKQQWPTGFLQSRWYELPSKERLGFVFNPMDCTLFCAYTIVPSNGPFPDCKSDTFNFWTSMPPEETVICNEMNENNWMKSKWMKSKTRNSSQMHSCMQCTLQAIAGSPYGAGFLCTLFALCLCSWVQHTWREGGRYISFLRSDFHSKWCWFISGILCFFLLKSNGEKENSRIAALNAV